MRKILFILAIFALSLGAVAQKGKVFSIAVDTLNGNETVNFAAIEYTNSGVLTIQALCTEIGGTSDGSLVLDASVDGVSYETLTSTTDLVYGFPNDTLTITDGAVVTWLIKAPGWRFYRVKGAGTASDSTLITIKYIYK